MQATALRIEVFNANASLVDARHEAITLARRLEMPVTFHYAESNYLILPPDTCLDSCKHCYPPAKTTKPEPHWEAS